jgi:methyl-accepting chemotaxis protein
MTIRNKLILGSSVLTGIILLLGILSWFYVGGLGKNVDEIVEWKIPAVQHAVDVHMGAYEATIEQMDYLLHEKPESHENVRIVLNKMEQDLASIEKVGLQFSDQLLLDHTAKVKAGIVQFKQLYEQGVQMLAKDKKIVKKMVKSGASLLAEADSFALKQQVEYVTLFNNGALQQKLNSKVQKYILINKIRSIAYSIIQHEKQERLYKDQRFYKKIQQKLPGLVALYDKLEKITTDKVGLEKISTARESTQQYRQAIADWVKNDTQLERVMSDMNVVAVNVRKSASVAEQDGWSKAKEVAEDTVSLVSQAHWMIILSLLIGTSIGIAVSIIIPKNITQSIDVLSTFATRFGLGDLTARTGYTAKDEMGVMAQGFDKAASNLQGIIRQVSDNATELTQQSSLLSGAVNKSTASIHTQKQHTEQVATAITAMVATVEEVSRNASHAADAANDADGRATEGNQVVSEAVSSITSLAGEINQATSVINQLESDVGNISSILDVIRSVSEQTNLLALNAAIEAARAGEHGRGFAVVADEVRTLASRTQASTDEIQTMIEKLQSGAQKAVEAMNASHEMTESSVQQASNSGEALQAITQSVATINDMNSQIALAVKQQSTVAEEISNSVATINSISEEGVSVANETSSASNNLDQLANNLKQSISNLTV